LTKEYFTVNSQEELMEVVESELEDEFNQEKKLHQICFEIGLNNTVNLLDQRTIQLCELYEGYKNAPHLIDKKIFLETVVILNQYQPRMF
jgi:hypothetical protein